HAVRDAGLGDRVEPQHPVARARDPAAVRVQDRPRDHVPVRAEVRLPRGAVQEHQGGQRRARDRGHPARSEPLVLDDRLHGLVPDGSAPKGSEIDTGYPEFDHLLLKKLGWWGELTPQEQALAEGKNWKTDVSGGIIRVTMKHGCAVYGNARSRASVWNFPDPV